MELLTFESIFARDWQIFGAEREEETRPIKISNTRNLTNPVLLICERRSRIGYWLHMFGIRDKTMKNEGHYSVKLSVTELLPLGDCG